MICGPCRKAGSLVPDALTDSSVLQKIEALHNSCEKGCDCQHRTPESKDSDG